MSVSDSTSKCSFLIDSGADISVLPLSFLSDKNSAVFPRPGQRLRAANGTFIDTFGKKSLLLTLPGFSARHSFRVAKVDKPILGADFFRKHSLLIDVKNNCLRLPGGNVISSTTSQSLGSVSTLTENFKEILAKFPDITSPKFEPEHVPAHGVLHVVPTQGPPVFSGLPRKNLTRCWRCRLFAPPALPGLHRSTWFLSRTGAGVHVETFGGSTMLRRMIDIRFHISIPLDLQRLVQRCSLSSTSSEDATKFPCTQVILRKRQ